MASILNLYELGQVPPSSNGWLVSDWEQFSPLMDWSADNVRKDVNGVHLILDKAPSGARNPYEGGEIQSDAVATTGTFTWTAKAPELVSGAVFGMFTFQADYRDPRAEFDFEFVGNTRTIEVVTHMSGSNGERISSPGRTIDLGFDAADGFHTYQVVATRHQEAAFLVDGKVIAYFSAADMPGGAWQTSPMRSYANVWASDSYWWAGEWKGLEGGKPLAATLSGAEVQAGVYAGIGQMSGTSGANSMKGTAADEIIRGWGGNDTLFGGAGRDFLRGGIGNDLLDGGTDDDRMEGGSGNDTFVFDAIGDAAVELAGGGTDQVRSSVDATLGSQVEDLVLTGSATLRGTGNDLANHITGNGSKNDLYGGAGSDTLDGGKGKDRLTGGDGNDQFVFAGPGQSGDTITYFGSQGGNDDRILIDASGFKGGLEKGGHLSREAFQAGEGHQAENQDVRFLFDTRNDTLWFDKNGSKEGGLTLVANLQDGANLAHDDIWLI